MLYMCAYLPQKGPVAATAATTFIMLAAVHPKPLRGVRAEWVINTFRASQVLLHASYTTATSCSVVVEESARCAFHTSQRKHDSKQWPGFSAVPTIQTSFL
jgi:hypothetical protein